jgi:hypothetical protein
MSDVSDLFLATPGPSKGEERVEIVHLRWERNTNRCPQMPRDSPRPTSFVLTARTRQVGMIPALEGGSRDGVLACPMVRTWSP